MKILVVEDDLSLSDVLAFTLRTRTAHMTQLARQAQVDGEALQKRCLDEATARFHDQIYQAKAKYEQSLQKANDQHAQALHDLTARKDQDMEALRARYEPHLENGTVVWAGVDYAAILAAAAPDADVLVWDGGNNDLPFYRPALHVVVADPLRLGNELAYHPGEANLRMAHVVVINKVDTADLASTETLRDRVRAANPDAVVVEAASPVMGEGAERITGRRVLVVEDGPTLTHGEMRFGAGTVLARKFGAGNS